jgi:hypothetical protein
LGNFLAKISLWVSPYKSIIWAGEGREDEEREERRGVIVGSSILAPILKSVLTVIVYYI